MSTAEWLAQGRVAGRNVRWASSDGETFATLVAKWVPVGEEVSVSSPNGGLVLVSRVLDGWVIRSIDAAGAEQVDQLRQLMAGRRG